MRPWGDATGLQASLPKRFTRRTLVVGWSQSLPGQVVAGPPRRSHLREKWGEPQPQKSTLSFLQCPTSSTGRPYVTWPGTSKVWTRSWGPLGVVPVLSATPVKSKRAGTGAELREVAHGGWVVGSGCDQEGTALMSMVGCGPRRRLPRGAAP